tara:strand:+ start:622 stop:849 length:228 start_codon:yes stop_codon:yes gene_type:complete
MSIIQEYWHQIIFLGVVIIMFTKLREQTAELTKDMEEIRKRELFAKHVELKSEVSLLNKQVSALWNFCNKIRDRQ